MTKGDVITQILVEVLDKPREEVEAIFRKGMDAFPGQYKFDEEISDLEAASMLEGLRRERSGIIAWAKRGAIVS